jgi:hypothetical protein
MKYMLAIYANETEWSELGDEGRRVMYEEYAAVSEELAGRGMMIDGAELRPTTAATTVRIRDGRTLVTDGPFAETKEQLGGYFVVDCESLDEAIEAAGKLPTARHGSIEVRPLVER